MKQSEPARRRKKFLFRFVVSYYIILIIPFLLVVFTYRTAADVIMRQSDSEVQAALVQAQSITDANLRAMPALAMSLRKDENVIDFYEKWAYGEDHIFPAYKVNHHIPQYNAANSLISNVYLYFGKKTGPARCFLIENGAAMEYVDRLADLTFDGTTLTYAELNDFISSNLSSERFAAFPTSVPDRFSIYFMSDIISYPSPNNSALVMIRLDDNFLNDLLKSATYDGKGTAFILNSDYQMLVCRNDAGLEDDFLRELIEDLPDKEETHFKYEGQQVNLVRSDRYGWIYGSLVPVSTVLSSLRHVRSIVAHASVIMLILSLILIGILTRRNSRPLGRIFGELSRVYQEPATFDSSNDFRFLESAITDLIQRNEEHADAEEARHRLYDLQILGHLLLAGEADSPLFKENLEHSTLLLEDRCLLVAYVHLHKMSLKASEPERSLSVSYMRQLEDQLNAKLYYFNIDNRNHVILFSFPETGSESELMPTIKEAINRQGEVYEEETLYHLDCFISDPVHDYRKISECYAQCKELAVNVLKDKELYAYSSEDLPEKPQVYHYSLNQEIRLSQLVRYGSQAKLQELLNEIHYQNYSLNTLNEAMQQSLFMAIHSSLQRGLASFYQEEEIHAILHQLRSAENFDELSRLLFELQAAMQSHLRQNSAHSNLDEIHQRILDYINQHYSNASLNQALLCEDLGISESIVNHMFQEMGSSFHVYLENVRIDAACTMLLNKEVTVKRVAEQTGYTSDVSFRRAFKRVLGISPTEFTKGREE